MAPTAPPSPSGDLAALERAIAALEAQRAVLGDEVVETALVPLRERQGQLLSGAAGEQRRLVSVLFADLVDFTVLSRRLDPEDTRSVVEACFAGWRNAVEAEGGVVEKFIGDAVMAVFGLQRSFEDDAERAVRAGLAMVAATAELGEEMRRRLDVTPQVRVGIDTGEVVVSTLGERAGQDFVAVGPTVNRAARLQSAAPVGRVLVSTETYQQVRRAFNVTPVPGLVLKGIDGAVDAYLVVSPRPRAFTLDRLGFLEGVETRTVGRTAQLNVLQERFLDVVDERRYLVVDVVGDAGIGKSRLLRDFDVWLAGQSQVVWGFRGQTSQVEQRRANSLTRDVLATRMEIVESDPPGAVRTKLEEGFARAYGPGEESRRAAHVVGTWLGFDLGEEAPLEGVPTDPQSLRDQAVRRVGEYFARLAAVHPVVILLEDLHWADAASLQLLDEAEQVWGDLPVLVVATTRSTLLEERPRWGSGLGHHVRLGLDALSRRESRALVLDLLQRVDDPPPELVDLVVDVAEGNPFYVEELVTWLIDTGVIVTEGTRWRVVDQLVQGIRVPPSLKGLLQARLDALTSTERAVLQRASVVGRVFWDDAVTHLADAATPTRGGREDGTPGAPLDQLLQRDLVFERELSVFDSAREFLFKHALLRDVAYESVLRSQRREYHRRAAVWLQQVTTRFGRVDEYAAIIAEHLGQAEDAEAAAWYLRAGRRAVRVFALDDAASLFDRAEQLAPADERRLLFDVVAEREDVYDRLGERAAQTAALDRMAALCLEIDDPRTTVTTLLRESRRAFEASSYDDAVDLARLATATARDHGLVEQVAQGHLWAGKSLTWHGRGAEARAELDAALGLARETERWATTGETLRYLAMLASNEGRLDEALDLGALSRDAFARDGDQEAETMALAQNAVTLFNLGRVEESRTVFEEVLPVFMASGHLYRQAVVLGNLASSSFHLGDLAAAERWCRQALERTDALEDVEAGATDHTILGLIQLWTGRWEESRRNFERSWRTGLDVGASIVALDAAAWLAIGMLEHGEPPDAVVAHTVALTQEAHTDTVGPQNAGQAQLAHAHALLATGDRDRLDDAGAATTEARRLLAEAGVDAALLQCDVLALAVDRARGRSAESLLPPAAVLVERLDQAALEVAMRPPLLLTTLAEALGTPAGDGYPAQRERLRRIARAYLDRRVAGAEDEATRRGFLSVPSVAHLVDLLATP